MGGQATHGDSKRDPKEIPHETQREDQRQKGRILCRSKHFWPHKRPKDNAFSSVSDVVRSTLVWYDLGDGTRSQYINTYTPNLYMYCNMRCCYVWIPILIFCIFHKPYCEFNVFNIFIDDITVKNNSKKLFHFFLNIR